jgi:hypothetical protein
MIRSGARHWRHISKSLTPGFEGVRRGVPASQKIEFAFLVVLIIRETAARGLRVPRPDFLALRFASLSWS